MAPTSAQTVQEQVMNKTHHSNGKPIVTGLLRPVRPDQLLTKDICPKTDAEKLVLGLLVEFLCKQEHRMGWARKSTFEGSSLAAYPNETVAAHQWGVAKLVMTLSRSNKFQEELPDFDTLKALEMALIHDVAELVVGDITPDDGVSAEVKHELERDAMAQILGRFPDSVGTSLHHIYDAYETRDCIESKFVKDCDKLDFMIHAFLLERQGFDDLEEFFVHTMDHGFSTKIANELAQAIISTRRDLQERNLLYQKT